MADELLSTSPIQAHDNYNTHVTPVTSHKKRQALSCTKCRSRKIKCDRIHPCGGCCAKGRPTECIFETTSGEEFAPIAQSSEIKRLRAEVDRLQELLMNKSADTLSVLGTEAAPITRAKFFKSTQPLDNLYFGAPAIAEVINQFRNVSLHDKTSPISHAIPRGSDMYTLPKVPYPFSCFWLSTSGTAPLVACLPPKEEMLRHMQAFQRRAQTCSFPHVPDEITEKEIGRFMLDPENNSEKHPDMLALILAALALGVQNGVYDASGGVWVEGEVERQQWKGDIWIAAAMQSLRLANYTSQPTLLTVQTLIIICPYLTNSGRFLDAWTLFGSCIRLAHSIGLHRDPKYFDPPPSRSESHIRKQLWWWMLHMDPQYSATLGRPLGISGIGDCPPPTSLTVDTTHSRVWTYIHHFTILTRQILSASSLDNKKIDLFTDKLLALKQTCPDLIQFDKSWLLPDKALPEWPLNALAAVLHGKLHNYLILLNRSRLEQDSSGDGEVRGRARVLESARTLLDVAELFDTRIQFALICWTLGQQAFNAAMILALNIIETQDISDLSRVQQAYLFFDRLGRLKVHKLASFAAERIHVLLQHIEGLSQTSDIQSPLPDTVMGNTGMILLEDPGQGFRGPTWEPLLWRGIDEDVSMAAPDTNRMDMELQSCQSVYFESGKMSTNALYQQVEDCNTNQFGCLRPAVQHNSASGGNLGCCTEHGESSSMS